MGCCESTNRHAGNAAFFSGLLSMEDAKSPNGEYRRPIVDTKFSNRSRILHVPRQFPTICSAIKAADAHDRILIAKGVYNEALLVDKAIELVGDGHHEDVIIKAEGATALTVESTSGGDEANLSVRVQNLTLQVQGGRGNFDHVVDNEGGSLHIEECLLEGGYWGVLNSNSAVAVLVKNKIMGCCGYGVFTADRSMLWMEGNSVSGHLLSGINVQGVDSRATLLDNDVSECKANGFMACAQAQVFLERNSICKNGDAGVSVCDAGTTAIIKNNTISKNGLVGVYVFDEASAVVEDNDLRENAHLALSVHKDCTDSVICSRNEA